MPLPTYLDFDRKKEELWSGNFYKNRTFDACLKYLKNTYAPFALIHELAVDVTGGPCVPGDLQALCQQTCDGFKTHCLRIDWSEFCDKKIAIYKCSANEFLNCERKLICDGVFDCSTFVDEQNCSNRFYCSDGSMSVEQSQMCDASPDCPDISDECQGCQTEGLSTDKDFIGNVNLRWFTVLQCVAILGLNCKAGVNYLRCEKKTKIGKIDQLMCTSLAAFDLLMGVYLLVVVSQIIRYHFYGPYCIKDLEWRTSLGCTLAGIIFSISTHGSLLTAMVMSVTRCYTCVKPFAEHHYKRTVIVLTVLQTASISLSIIPVLPLNLIQDLSAATVLFKDNIIVSRADDFMLKKILTAYKGASYKVDSLGRSEVLTALRKMTSDSSMFDISNYLGFYSSSPLCINIQHSLQHPVIKILYVAVVAVIIGIISLSYIIIAITTKKTQVPAQDNKPGNIEKKERMQFLSFKVTIIIIAQIACWVPILITSVLSLFGIKLSSVFYEVAAIIILPLNSVLDPILYTALLKIFFTFLKAKISSISHAAIDFILTHVFRREPIQVVNIELQELNFAEIQADTVSA